MGGVCDELYTYAGGNKLLFEPGEKLEFGIKDVTYDERYGNLKVNVTVLTGKQQGKTTLIYISPWPKLLSQFKSLEPFLKTRVADFITGLWTREKLQECSPEGKPDDEKPLPLSDLIGKKVFAIAAAPREKDGEFYQNFKKWKMIGNFDLEEKEEVVSF